MSDKWESLNSDDDVVHFEQQKLSGLSATLLNSQLSKSVENKFAGSYGYTQANIFEEGLKSKILTPGKQWRTGKIRMRLSFEFCPDEPEQEAVLESNLLEASSESSPLDDLREQFQQTTG